MSRKKHGGGGAGYGADFSCEISEHRCFESHASGSTMLFEKTLESHTVEM
jgi:hypothetical protein